LIEERKVAAVRGMRYGLERRAAWRKLNKEIAAGNRVAIESCDLLLAILDGPDIDSGTACEIGYAFAKGKPILGYRSDYRMCADNEAATVNLQVEYFIRESGGDIIASVRDLDGSLAKCLVSLRRHSDVVPNT
jgi:nucleoside 2-deoxyribosyltransferase